METKHTPAPKIAAHIGEDYATVYFDEPLSIDAFTISYPSDDAAELLGLMIERHNAHDRLLEVVRIMANFDGRNNNNHLKEMAKSAIAEAEGK